MVRASFTSISLVHAALIHISKKKKITFFKIKLHFLNTYKQGGKKGGGGGGGGVRERERERQTDRQTDRQTETGRGRQTERQR